MRFFLLFLVFVSVILSALGCDSQTTVTPTDKKGSNAAARADKKGDN